MAPVGHTSDKAIIIIGHPPEGDDPLLNDATRGKDWIKNEVILPGETTNLYQGALGHCYALKRPVITIYDLPYYPMNLVNPVDGTASEMLPQTGWPTSFMYNFAYVGGNYQAGGPAAITPEVLGEYNIIWATARCVNRISDVAIEYLDKNEFIETCGKNGHSDEWVNNYSKSGSESTYCQQPGVKYQPVELALHGTSKRAWTGWFVAGTDLIKRVTALSSTAFDFFHAEQIMLRHYESFGGFSYAFGDFLAAGLINHMDNPVMALMFSYIDPISMVDRIKANNVQVLMQQIAQDEFFTIENPEIWWEDVKGRLGDNLSFRMIMNSFHFLLGHENQQQAMGNQRHYHQVAREFLGEVWSWDQSENGDWSHKMYPSVDMKVTWNEDDTNVVLKAAHDFSHIPVAAFAWTGFTPIPATDDRRDFRLFSLAGIMQGVPDRPVGFYPMTACQLNTEDFSMPCNDISATSPFAAFGYTQPIEQNMSGTDVDFPGKRVWSTSMNVAQFLAGQKFGATFFQFFFSCQSQGFCESSSPAAILPKGRPFPAMTCQFDDTCDMSMLKNSGKYADIFV